jgi:hypothetical protein
MRIVLIYVQVRCEQLEGPEENMSRYTVRPGTLGLTLVMFSRVLDNPRDLEENDMSPSRYEQAVRASLAERGLCVVFQVVT